MTIEHTAQALDRSTAERLSRGFGATFETFDARPDVFAPDAFFDLNMPVWRFQLQGRDAFATQLRSIAEGPVRLEVTRTVPTVDGFVHEHVEHQQVGDEEHSARRLWFCEVRHGVIVEATGYCSGEWDEELRQRHAREAPMLRD